MWRLPKAKKRDMASYLGCLHGMRKVLPADHVRNKVDSFAEGNS